MSRPGFCGMGMALIRRHGFVDWSSLLGYHGSSIQTKRFTPGMDVKQRDSLVS